MLEYFHTQASSIGFPELALPTVIQVKQLILDWSRPGKRSDLIYQIYKIYFVALTSDKGVTLNLILIVQNLSE